MSYGTSSYGETSYGEEAGGDSGLRFISEGISVSLVTVGQWDSNNTFTDIVNALDTVIGKKAYNTFSVEDIQISETIVLKEILNIIEAIQASDTLVSSGNFGIICVSGIDVDDELFVAFPISVLDAMGINDSLIIEKAQFIELLEQAEISELLASATVWNIANSDDIQIADSVNQFWAQIVSEILNTSDILTVHRVANITADEIVEISGTALQSVRFAVEAISGVLMSEDPLGSSQDGTAEIEDDILLTTLLDKVDIEGYVMNPENYAVSKYLLGFTEAASFGDQFLYADDTGLYELGGTTDNGSAIVATIQTAALDLGTSNIKQMPSVMLGTNGTKAILKVSVDGSHTHLYEVTGRSSALMTKHVKLGKGLIGKYWQFTVISDSEDFDLDSFEFYPIIFGRKHNG